MAIDPKRADEARAVFREIRRDIERSLALRRAKREIERRLALRRQPKAPALHGLN